MGNRQTVVNSHTERLALVATAHVAQFFLGFGVSRDYSQTVDRLRWKRNDSASLENS